MVAVADTVSPIEVIGRFIESAPTDLDGMAEALGAEVLLDQAMGNDVSGKIERHGKGYRITINGNDHPRRQRFTLAHELAHLILHRDLIGDGVVDNAMYRSKTLSNAIESQANRFAADLLMPARLVRQFWREGIKSVAQMAAKFDVSTAAARIRIVDLGYGA